MMKKLTQIWTKKPIVQAIALALYMGTMGTSYAEVKSYTAGGGSVNSKSGAEGSIAIGSGAKTTNDGGEYVSLAIGRDSLVYDGNPNAKQEAPFSFSNPIAGGFVIGLNTYARTMSLEIGNNPNRNGTRSGHIVAMTTLGSSSANKGIFSSILGSYNKTTGGFDGSGSASISYGVQNFTSTIAGSLNAVISKTSGAKLFFPDVGGMADSIIGIANLAENSNAALIFGAGNKITNAIASVTVPGIGLLPQSFPSSDKFRDDLVNSVKTSNSSGSTMAFGGGNTADYTLRSSIVGVNNTLKGKSSNKSQQNFISGVNNTATDIDKSTVIGSNNRLSNGTNLILLGDYRAIEGTTTPVNNVIALGSVDAQSNAIDESKKITTSGATAIGHNAYVDPASQGSTDERASVALGENSVARTAAGQIGYNPETKAVYDSANDATSPAQDISVWQATADAISVGDTENGITRQINGVAAGTEDTDAINVAQLKRAKAAITEIADTKLKPKIAGDDNIVVTAAPDQTTPSEYTVGLADDLQLNTMIVGDNQEVVIDNQGINIGQDKVIINDQGVFVANGPTITEDGIDANDQVVSDVADGVDETDAVNVHQLNSVSQNLSAINSSIFDIEPTIKDTRRELRGIGANIGALMGLPQVMQPGKAMFAASAGAYKGEYSFAVGWSRGSDNGKSIFKISASVNTVKDVSVNLGFGFQF